MIADNLIAGARRGAIVGVDRHAAVTGDLVGDGARHAHLTISGNRGADRHRLRAGAHSPRARLPTISTM